MVTRSKPLDVLVSLFEFDDIPSVVILALENKGEWDFYNIFKDGQFHNVSYVRSFGDHKVYIDAKKIIAYKDRETILLDVLMNDMTISYDLFIDEDVPQIKNYSSWKKSLTSYEIGLLVKFRTQLILEQA